MYFARCLNEPLCLLLCVSGVPEGVAPGLAGPTTDGPQQAHGHHTEELPRLQD